MMGTVCLLSVTFTYVLFLLRRERSTARDGKATGKGATAGNIVDPD